MGTSRSPELIQQIADATSFSKMKEAKAESLDSVNSILGKVSMEYVFLLVYWHHTYWFCLFLLCVCFLFKPTKSSPPSTLQHGHHCKGTLASTLRQAQLAKHTAPRAARHKQPQQGCIGNALCFSWKCLCFSEEIKQHVCILLYNFY